MVQSVLRDTGYQLMVDADLVTKAANHSGVAGSKSVGPFPQEPRFLTRLPMKRNVPSPT